MGKHNILFSQSIKDVWLEKPLQGCYKLNTKETAKGNLGPAACSTVVRDSNGKWVVACSRGIGHYKLCS